MMKFLKATIVASLLAAPLSWANAQTPTEVAANRVGDRDSMYEVTITNITRGSLFSPILVASHREGVSLFALGQPASVELAHIAEGGNIDPLKRVLQADDRVFDITDSGGPLMPGQSVTVRVGAQGVDQISLAAMIVPTNDGFIALNGVQAPRSGSVTYSIPGYDAGTELNDENCASIPGPQCGGQGFSEADGEGFVHIHRGIHGIADLKAEDYDWRNPVASVTIKKSTR